MHYGSIKTMIRLYVRERERVRERETERERVGMREKEREIVATNICSHLVVL